MSKKILKVLKDESKSSWLEFDNDSKSMRHKRKYSKFCAPKYNIKKVKNTTYRMGEKYISLDYTAQHERSSPPSRVQTCTLCGGCTES